MGFFGDLGERHERLKERIHNFRIPLSRRGQLVMGCVYCGAPLLAGFFIYRWSRRKADENLGVEGTLLRERMTATRRAQIRQENREKMEAIRRLGTGSGSDDWAAEIDSLRSGKVPASEQ